MPKYSKPKVLVVADQPLWAFYYIQKFILDKLSDEYDFYTDYISHYQLITSFGLISKIKNQLLRTLYSCKYRRVHRGHPVFEYDLVILLGFYFDTMYDYSFKAKKTIKGIYNDDFPPLGVSEFDKDITTAQFAEKYLWNASTIVCGSKEIADIYKNEFPKEYSANVCYDEKVFAPPNQFSENTSQRFVVGWTGKPHRKFKGYYDYVMPAVELASRMRPGIELKSRFSGPFETLHQFFADVDVVLIASDADAGPSLFMEAALCGVPSISTKIGWPRTVIRDHINGFFVERDIEEMAKTIVKLYDDRKLLLKMSKQIREDFIATLGETIQENNWRRLISEVLCSSYALGDNSQ